MRLSPNLPNYRLTPLFDPNVVGPWERVGTTVSLDTTTDNVVIGGSTAGGKLFIDGDTDEIQLQVQGNAVQTALLVVFENSAGVDQITFAADGGTVFNEAGNAVNFRIEGDTDANLFTVSGTPSVITIGSASNLAKFAIDGVTDEFQFLVQGNALQTASLVVFENSAGTDLLTVSNGGQLALPTVGSTGGLLIGADVNVFRGAADRLDIGDSLIIDGSTDAVQLTVQGNATQTSLLAVFEDSAGTDQITFSNTGATVFNEVGNDADFRIEGDTQANLFFLDASADKIGINTSTPGYQLNLIGSGAFDNGSSGMRIEYSDNLAAPTGILSFFKSRGTATVPTIVNNGDRIANLLFKGHDGVTYQFGAAITVEIDAAPAASDMPSAIYLWTTPDGGTAVRKAFVVDNIGYVGIAVSPDPVARLDVWEKTDAASNLVSVFRGGDRAVPAANDEGYISLYNDDSAGTSAEFSRLTWVATDVTAASKDSQVEFACMAANTLTDIFFVKNADVDLRVSTANIQVNGADPEKSISVPVYAMWPSTTNGAGAITKTNYATNGIDTQQSSFDQTTEQYLQFTITMPGTWNGGTVRAVFYWTAAAGTGDVVWGLQGRSYGDNEVIDQAFGTAQTVTDTLITTNNKHKTGVTAAITLAGTPAANEMVQYRVLRQAAAAGDTLNAAAGLIGVMIYYTTAQYNDGP